jgi:hypothetical protein
MVLSDDELLDDILDRAALWERGVLRWKHHAGQDVIEQTYLRAQNAWPFFVAEVSRQFGKTYWALCKAIETAIQNPRASIRIATAFFSDLEGIVLPVFETIFLDCPPALAPKYNHSKARFVFQNGSDITLVGLDKNPHKLRGSRLRLVVIDEAGFVDSDTLKYAIEAVIIPAFTHEPDARCILISTPPPQGQDHFFSSFADQALLQGTYVKFTIDDNPMLSEERKRELAEAIGGKDSVAYRREYLCERIVDVTRAIIPDFDRARHVEEVPRPDYFRYLHRYEALDSGVADKTVGLFGYYDFPKARLVIEGEFWLQNEAVTTRNIAQAVRNVERELGYDAEELLPVYRRVADNDNQILLQDLGTTEGLWFTPTTKDALEAMVNHLRLMFQDNRIVIHPRCKLLILTLGSALWNKRRDAFDRSEATGHADALAALVYLARNLDRHTNPFPPFYGVDVGNSFILTPPKPRQSRAAKALSEVFLEKKR